MHVSLIDEVDAGYQSHSSPQCCPLSPDQSEMLSPVSKTE